MIITIDGPVATGKSSVARGLAEAIGFIYFDTGAMYRAVTYAVIQHNISLDDEAALAACLSSLQLEIKIKKGERRYYVDQEDVTDKIRLSEVTSQVSRVSANGKVREKLVERQRELSVGVNAVFEGRDMGTVVFPQADLKIFLTGRLEVRAKRRFDELKAKYPDNFKELTLEQAMQDVLARDEYDTKREISPLKKADDALEVDTSDLTLDEVIYKILELKDTRKTRKANPLN